MMWRAKKMQQTMPMAFMGRTKKRIFDFLGAVFIGFIIAFWVLWRGKIKIMFESLIGLIAAAEIASAQVEVQEKADAYFAVANQMTVTYDVSYRGTILSDKGEFSRMTDEILADARGWKRAGIRFKRVESGGRMHVILAEPKEVAAAAPTVCSDKLSCSVGSLVLINDDRWRGGSDSYNELGVSIERYRQMVLNHEVGHFLGHRHILTCETATGQAPVMLQQSTGLAGCEPNSWPLPSELWVRL